jgi:uncharacterized lipoprotein
MKPLYRLLITSLILAFLSACSSSSDPAATSSGTAAESSDTAAESSDTATATNKFPQVTVSD